MSVVDIFFIATTMGLLGSVHCVAMCGPIIIGVFRQGALQNPRTYFLYHLGKLLAYASIGLLFGLVGKSFHLFLSQQKLSIWTGVFLLIYFIIQRISRVNGVWNRFSNQLYTRFQIQIRELSLPKYYALGLLNGYLPCGLVYLAAMSSTSTGHISDSVLWMIFFGLGTIPSLSLILWISNISHHWLKGMMDYLYRYLGLLVAVLLILRGLNLGIPLLSPHYDKEQQHVSKCCKG